MIDLDLAAAQREISNPEGLPLKFRGQEFLLPAELPVDVFDPFLSEEFDLAGLIREGVTRYKAAKSAEDDGGKKVSIAGIVVDTLFDRPTLPLDLLDAIYSAFELLFGAEQYATFKALRPSIPDYAALMAGLFQEYGVSLGEAFASPSSSETDGATQKETSESTPTSTPEVSGDGEVSAPASSE